MVIHLSNRQLVGSAISGCFLLASLSGQAQDLGEVGKKGGFQMGGGLSAYAGAYSTGLDRPQQVPLTWGVTARLNLSLYGLQIPFSVTFSERERSFRQPFNQYGASPRYKWVRLHLGYRTMHFSQLTMTGQNFLGGGVELTPGKFRFEAMYGRLRREVYADSSNTFSVDPAFERWAWAVKAGVGTEASHVELIALRAWDRYDPIKEANTDHGKVQPEENAVLGIDIAQVFWKRLRLQVDAAVSLHNVGVTPQERTEGLVDLSRNYDSFLFNVDPITRIGTAAKAGLSYSMRGLTLSVNYDRMDPFFRTLGCYYMLSDVENFRGTAGIGLFKQKVRIQATLGRQHNDLGHTAVQRNVRTIGSGSISYNSGRVATVTLDVSNFQTDYRSAFLAAQTDSFFVSQVARSIGLTNSIRIGKGKGALSHTADLSIGLQDFADNGSAQGTGSNSKNASVGYRYQNKHRHLSWGVRWTGSKFSSYGAERTKLGFSANVRKGLLADRLGISLRLGLYDNRAPNGVHGLSETISVAVEQKVARIHQLGFSVNYNGRSDLGSFASAQYQLRAQVTYSVSFQTAPDRTKTKGQ
ncbi:MAG TPA: hypothetical protein PLE78_10515 [Flavobacteriales bacterium]|nr:hypothetical protein [Flavobacteriales bacterium]HQW40686.1 hypothetical protein [Flavobacteriales bacterium]